VVRLVDELEFPNHTVSVRYRFVHIFYQNAVYELLVPSRRTAMSLAVARALVALTGDQSQPYAADLALLFESGRDFANAARYFLEAARDAARVFAYPETEILCHRGLASIALLPESRERDTQELLFSLTLGMALMSTRGYTAPEVERTLGRSRELCLELNATRRLSSVLWGLHTCHANRGDLTRALEAAHEMRQVADAVAEPLAVIESLHALGTTLAFMGRWAEAREALERIFELDPVSQHSFHGALYVLDPCVTSLSMLARVLAVEGHLDQAAEKAASSLELARRLAHPPSLAYATFWMGWVQNARGDCVEGRRELESSMALSRAHGLQLFLEWGRIVRGSILTQMGSVAEGIAEIRKSIDRLTAMGAMLDRSYCLTVLAAGLGRVGACEEALALCAEALEFARRTKGGWYEPETHRVRGDVLLAMGDDARLPEVETEFAQARQLARQAGSRLLELKACISDCRLRRILGDPDAGFAVLSDVLVGFTEGLHSPAISDAWNVANGVAAARAPDTFEAS